MQSATPGSLAVEICASRGDDALRLQKISFADKYIVNVIVNDVVDSTFDIPLATLAQVNRVLQHEESLPVEPVVLVGDPNNLKAQVMVGQLGKVILQLGAPKNTILSINSRWLGPAEATDGDLEKLLFLLLQMKLLFQ